MWFLGVDLAWQNAPSGVALLELSGARLYLRHLDRLGRRCEILPWLEGRIGGADCYIGIDAPVLVPNQRGMREADRLTHRLYGRQNAGAYPIHLGLPFVPQILAFVEELEAAGFQTELPIAPRERGRRVFEVFPHASSVRLFQLSKILPYKKGPIASRIVALTQFRSLLGEKLAEREPKFQSKRLPEIPMGGKELKAVEDQLDALLCAYSAAHFFYWGLAKNNILGGALVAPSF
jgi:predicted RNase H-like nuclease